MTVWLLANGEVRLPWIKFAVPADLRVSDAIICRKMTKAFVGSERGRILIFDALGLEGGFNDSERQLGLKKEARMVKVAHQVRMTTL